MGLETIVSADAATSQTDDRKVLGAGRFGYGASPKRTSRIDRHSSRSETPTTCFFSFGPLVAPRSERLFSFVYVLILFFIRKQT